MTDNDSNNNISNLIPVLALIAVAIGAGNVVKSGVNSSLGVEVNASSFGALISMAGGTLVTVCMMWGSYSFV